MPEGYTGAILSERRFTTKLPWLVRESVPITTPPSNVAANMVVAFTALAINNRRRKDAAIAIEAARLINAVDMGNASSSASQPQLQQW